MSDELYSYLLEIKEKPDRGEYRKRGTAWFIRSQLLITASHVVCHGDDSSFWYQEKFPQARYWLTSGPGIQQPVELSPLLKDPSTDLALLSSKDFNGKILPLAERIVKETGWWADGYPTSEGRKPFALNGTVTHVWNHYSGEGLQLLVHQGTNETWGGASGSPVYSSSKFVLGVLTQEKPNANTVRGVSAMAVRRLVLIHDMADLLSGSLQDHELSELVSTLLAQTATVQVPTFARTAAERLTWLAVLKGEGGFRRIAEVLGKEQRTREHVTKFQTVVSEWARAVTQNQRSSEPTVPILLEKFLYQYIGNPDKPVPFGGRTSDLTKLDEWLADKSAPPYMVVTSFAGKGKSALLTRWHHRLKESGVQEDGLSVYVVFWPISVRYRLNTEMEVFRSLATQIAAVHGETVAFGSSQEYRKTFEGYLQRSLPGRSVLLVILDSLDEATGWDAGPSLFPLQPGHGVKVLVSARLTATNPTPESWLKQLELDSSHTRTLPLGKLSREGVQDAMATLESPLETLTKNLDFASHLFRLSDDGDPLILSLYLQDLRDQLPATSDAALERLSRMPPGLEGYMDQWWKGQEHLWGAQRGMQEPKARMVFNILSCAFEPLSRKEIIVLAQKEISIFDGDALDIVLRILDRFLIQPTSGSYAICHPRLGEYRLNKLKQDGELERYENLFIQWSEREFNEVRDQIRQANSLSRYVVRHYGDHLERAEVTPDRLGILISSEWQSAGNLSTEEFNGWLTDLNLVDRVAAKINQAAITRGEPAPFLDIQLQTLIARSQVTATSQLISAGLVARLVQHGIDWTEGRGLSFLRSLESIDCRAAGLADLAPYLRQLKNLRVAAEWLSDLSGAWTEDYGRALAAVCAQYAELGDVQEARTLIMAQNPGFARGYAQIKLLRFLDHSQQIETVRSIFDDVSAATRGDFLDLLQILTAEVTCELATKALRYKAVSRRQSSAPVQAILDAIRDAEEGDRNAQMDPFELSLVATWLSDDDRDREVSRVLDGLQYEVDRRVESLSSEESNSESHRSIAQGVNALELIDDIIKISPHLRGQLLRKALSCVDKLEPFAHGNSPRAWIALFPNLTLQERDTYLDRLIDAIPVILDIPTVDKRTDYLTTLARLGYVSQIFEALEKVGEDDWFKVEYIKAIAPFMDQLQVAKALERINQIRQETRVEATQVLLARLASFGPTQAKKALSLTAAFEDVDEIRTAASVLNQATTTQWDLADILKIENRSFRFAALAATSQGKNLNGHDFAAAVKSFNDTEVYKDNLVEEAFALLHPRLTADELGSSEATVISDEVVLHGRYDRDEIVIRYFQRRAEVRGVQETLSYSRRLSSDAFKVPLAWCIIAVADLLDESEVIGVQQDTMHMLQEPDQCLKGAAALAALIDRLPPSQQEQAFRQMMEPLSQTDTVHQPRWISLLLARLPERFQAEAITRLVPDSLINGNSRFLNNDTWAEQMTDLVPVLKLEQVQRLFEAAEKVKSSSFKSRLRAAVVARLAVLQHADEAFSKLPKVSYHRTTALLGMVDALPPERLEQWINEVHKHISFENHRDQRAQLWAKVNGRLWEVEKSQLWQIFEAWKCRRLTRAEFLIDLIAYTPVILALDGKGAGTVLSDYLAEFKSPTTSSHESVTL